MVIALIPQHARKIAPPRTLAVPFILGRPLGVPDDAAFQHRVLDRALALFDQNDSPVFATFEEDAPAVAADEEPWVCPVSFAGQAVENAGAALLSEIELLMPWYQRGLSERGHTAVGLSQLSLPDIASLLSAFAEGDVPAGDADQQLKNAAEDLKAFYNEAAVSQPGTATAKAIEDWYWQSTEAGKLIQQISRELADHSDGLLKLTAGFLLVPGSQRQAQQ